jgi:hypothetical protein
MVKRSNPPNRYQIRKFKITKLKQQVMPTYYHTENLNDFGTTVI